MSGKEIYFGDKKINKKDFYDNKKQFKIKDIDTNKILISRLESYGKKNAKRYIIGYSDDAIRTLPILLPQMTGYLNCFDGNKKMSFLADNNKLLKKYTKVWEKIRDLIGKKFDSEPVYGDKYINTKIRPDNNDIRTNFSGEGNSRKVPKEKCPYKCLSLISLGKNIFLKHFLKSVNTSLK